MAVSSGYTKMNKLFYPSPSPYFIQNPAVLVAYFMKHNLYYSFSEVIGGYISGSLAIMSDAAHMFSDLASFLISLLAIHLSEKPAKKVPLML